MKILIETIPHSSQRYRTCGDWFRNPDGVLVIRVSQEVGDEAALLIAIHELVEQTLCEKRGITTEMVDTFDMSFELHRKPGDDSEPGDDPACPCKKEHRFAENIERQIAFELGVDWHEYAKTVDALP